MIDGSLSYWMRCWLVRAFAKDSKTWLLTGHKARPGVAFCAGFCLNLNTITHLPQ